ncbi:prohead core scaffold protein [Proteus phage SJ_PmiM]|nr:prohead core scaffold protein [Proteus phage SJ_PmiM]
MLKEFLIEEAEKLNDVSVALDGIFESVELSDDVKAQFSTVFETAVKSNAIKLAESHITELTEKAETKEQELKESIQESVEKEMAENISKFMDHVSQEWLEENKLAVTNGIKADLFESMFQSIKTVVIDHNIILPEESVDVVKEMEEELEESKTEVASLFDKTVSLQEKVNTLEKEKIIKEQTAELTESQKEKVANLIEGIAYGEKFKSSLEAIVSMVSKTSEKAPISEDINTTDESGMNYTPENTGAKSDPMSVYTAAAKKIN